MSSRPPVVAIVGRPNTGKSSLFNLLVGEQKSIVDERAGVTRDINIGTVRTDRFSFLLYDTAGYLDEGDEFNALVQKKVRDGIKDADMVLLVVDGRDYHPLDEEIALLLKREDKRVLVIVNKLDNRDMESAAMEFYQLGFGELMPFSVVHRRGYRTLLEKIEETMKSGEFASEDGEEEISIAIVGKPNAGKSQLLNTLLGQPRSIVSDIPGTTRDSIDDIFHWQGKKIRLIDTAGLRRKAKVDDDIEYYSSVRTVQAIERSQVVIQLIDAFDGVTAQDKRISEMVIDKGRGLVFAYNKWDLVRGEGDENYFVMDEFKKKIYKELPEFHYVPLEFISAKDNYKIQRLMDTALRVHRDYSYRVPTGKLNEWLDNTIRESDENRPMSNLKVYYATQIYTAPPGFMFFINKMDCVRKDYPRYLENRLRLAFEFTGVPIKIVFREKEKKVWKNDHK